MRETRNGLRPCKATKLIKQHSTLEAIYNCYFHTFLVQDGFVCALIEDEEGVVHKVSYNRIIFEDVN